MTQDNDDRRRLFEALINLHYRLGDLDLNEDADNSKLAAWEAKLKAITDEWQALDLPNLTEDIQAAARIAAEIWHYETQDGRAWRSAAIRVRREAGETP